jgi:hypothetical protein
VDPDVDTPSPATEETTETKNPDQTSTPAAGDGSGHDVASTHFPSFLEKCSFQHMEAKFGELRDSMTVTSALLDVVRQPTQDHTCTHAHAHACRGERSVSLGCTLTGYPSVWLEQLVQGLTVVGVLPTSGDHPYEEVSVVDTIIPESVPWRHDLQPYHMGYEVPTVLLFV